MARGTASVRFSGSKGKVLRLKEGDVVILPAGTGHEALSASQDLLVVGAYPAAGEYDEYRASKDEHDKAVSLIRHVALPAKDPIYGARGTRRRKDYRLPRGRRPAHRYERRAA